MVKIYTSEEELKSIFNALPIPATAQYMQAKSDNYGWFVSENFILPFIIDEKLIFKRMIFTFAPIPLQKELSIADEKIFLDEMVDLTKKESLCDFINKPQAYAIFRTYPTQSQYAPWGTYEIDITNDEQSILHSFHKSHIKALQNAIKDDIKIDFDLPANQLHEIVYDSVKRTGSLACPPLEYFQKIKDTLGKNSLFIGAFKDDILQSALMILFDDKVAYELYGGYIFGAHKGSGHLLKYEAIKYIKKHSKAQIFNLCGVRINVKPDSKYAAIQQYKERFNPKLIEGYAFKVIIKPLKTKLFNLLVKLYSKRKGIHYVDPIDQLLTGDYD